MTRRRVAITGLGIVSPYGGGVDAFFAHLLAGRSAVQLLQTDDKPRPLNMPFVSCNGFDPAAALGKPLAGMMERFSHLGVAAAFDAWQDAGLERQTGTTRPSATTGAASGAPPSVASWPSRRATSDRGKTAASACRRCRW
jgi:3-oxoacyl-(acyl-carrier-protein) synthase